MQKEEIVIQSDTMLLVAMGANRTEIIKILQKAIADLENDANTSTRSLYTKDDILYKLNNALALHVAKGDDNTIDLREMQVVADDCKGANCHNCAFDNVVETYSLWDRENKPLLERVIMKLELIPYGQFRSVQLTTDILIRAIKISILELNSKEEEKK